MFKLNFVYCLLLVGLTATSVHADIFRVDAAAPSGGDGTTWATAFNDLQVAFDAARDNGDSIDEIWLRGGTYLPTYRMDEDPAFGEDGYNPRAVVLVPRGNVEVYGGFGGWEIQRDERDIVANPTIISGDLEGNDLPNWQNRQDNAYVLFLLSLEGWGTCDNHDPDDLAVVGPIVLDGLTIRGGHNDSDGSTCWRRGGGVAIKSHTNDAWIEHRLTVTDCVIEDNFADYPGNEGRSGIVETNYLPVTFERVDIVDNWAESRIVYFYGNPGTPSFMHDCTLARNGRPDHKIRGEAIYVNGQDGGTDDNYEWRLGTQITNCRFLDNHVHYGGGTAPPAHHFDGKVRLNNCVFAGNSAGSGAGFRLTSGESYADRSAIASNCLVFGNYTQDQVGDPPGEIGCGGVELGNNGTLYNCIIWGNDGRDDEVAGAWGNSVCRSGSGNWYPGEIQSCLIDGMKNGTAGPLGYFPVVDCLDADPILMNPFGADGIAGTGDEDYRLGEGSPCIDRGNNEYVLIDGNDLDGDGDHFELLSLDLAMNYRFVDVETVPDLGTAAPGYPYIVDIGPLEVPACPTCPGDRIWVGSDGLWGDVFNWFPAIPGPASTIIFEHDGELDVTMNADGFGLRLEHRTGELRLDADGHALELNSDVTESLIIGRDDGDNAAFVFTNGTLDAQACMLGEQIGTAGSLTIGEQAMATFQRSLTVGLGGVGQLSVVDGGTCIARDLVVGDSAIGSGSVLVSGSGSRLSVPFFMLIDNGTVDIGAGATLDVDVLGTALFQDAQLTGSGTIESDVYNFGTVDPDGGEGRTGAVLTIQGRFEQIADIFGMGSTAGVVRIDTSDVGHDQLIVNGTAVLSGGMRIVAEPEWNPASGTEFQCFLADDIEGRFDVAFMPGLGADQYAKLVYPGEARGSKNVISIQIDDFENVLGFGDPDSIDLDSEPSDLVVADFNADELADIAMTMPGSGAGSVLVLINDGAGGFGSTQQITVGDGPVSIAAGDVDGDGNIDLATADANAGGISVLTGSAGGTFGTAIAFATGSSPSCITMLDADGDDVSEIVVGDLVEEKLTILSGLNLRGGGNTIDIPGGGGPVILDPSENEDQKDWVGVGYGTAQGDAGQLVKTAEGWAIASLLPTGTAPNGLTANDLNADGRTDLIFTGENGVVSVMLTDGFGVLSPAVLLPAADMVAAPVSVDFDNDGDNDILMLGASEGSELGGMLLRNDSNLTDFEQLLLADGMDVDLGINPLLLGAGDLDGDGLDDVVSINGADALRGTLSQLSRMSNDSEPPAAEPCPGDSNGDEVVDIMDLLALLAQWGSCDGCSADYNNSGVVDIEDLLIMLGGWGACDGTN